MRRSLLTPRVGAVGIAMLTAAAVAYVVSTSRPSSSRTATERASDGERAVEEVPSLERPEAIRESPPAPPRPARLDEHTLMTRLRERGPKDPEQAIRLAREGNDRFPTSPDAAERAWFVVKSLSGLGRFHEARSEALVMVRRFRGTPWADDVERHTLVYPLDQPSREETQELGEPEAAR